ncbi:hypothetical protein HK414_01265 [Ramlibacter terrae]|uniref:Uncharacterized protein n=1 Tax=Ramlibacter terrae TaxID=2732511 RepID=A0ABX6P2X8_9BURK|nr:hypothetical protein HK414_01265 [Ramlibacter terrae]
MPIAAPLADLVLGLAHASAGAGKLEASALRFTQGELVLEIAHRPWPACRPAATACGRRAPNSRA